MASPVTSAMLTQLYLFGRVELVLDMRNARPAFPAPTKKEVKP